MSVRVTGATRFIGADVAKLASERLGPPRVTYRDERRLERLAGTDAEPVRADVLDRGALRRELGYRARPLARTLTDTIDWYRDLIDSGRRGGGPPSPLSVAAAGVQLAGRAGLLGGLRAAERRVDRRLVAP